MNSSFLAAAAEHLWQSTLFAVAATCLALFLRRNSARVRWFVWLAASAKFLLPFTLLTAAGAQFPWRSGPVHLMPAFLATVSQTAAKVTQISEEPVVTVARAAHDATDGQLSLIVLELVWALGAFLLAVRWFKHWLILRGVLQASSATSLAFEIPVRSVAAQLEPAVVGVLRPVLLLPKGLQQHLAPAELEAVLAHERCHVRWRDNLATTLHMLVEVVFWFHPLVWWLGKRMIDERERACDEWVLAQGHVATSYAEGILKVCEHYLKSPTATAACVGGGHLSQRIDAIMHKRLIVRMSVFRKLVLVAAACAAIAVPLVIGSLASPDSSAAAAEASASELRNVAIKLVTSPFEPEFPHKNFVSIRLMGDNGTQVQLAYTSLRDLVAAAYGVHPSQVVGKDLSKEPLYTITADNSNSWVAKASDSVEERARKFRVFNHELPAAQRDLLAKQFGLVVKRERRQMYGYVLTVGPGGSKLRPDTDATYIEQGSGQSDRELIATMEPASLIVHVLEDMFYAPVVDRTGLNSVNYDYKLTWTPVAPGTTPSMAAMSKALAELGLRLEAEPVTVDVINVISLKSPEQVLASK